MDPGQENINPINSAGECLLPSPVSSPRQPKRAEAAGDDGLGVVRIKPLGVGGGGVERTAAEADGKGAVSFDLGANEVEVRGRRFEYPSHVIGPDSSQEELYQGYMPPRIAGFLAGYNCNIMAYGQTGTGKTHTMFGPPGVMARAAKGKFGIDVIPEYGLFPRGLIELYHSLQALRAAGGETEYVMTVSAVELALEGNLDMFDKSAAQGLKGHPMLVDTGAAGVSLDRTCFPARLYGMTELPLDTPEAVLRTFQALASRNTAGTTMNDSSSRSHCFVFLNLYAHRGGEVRCSRFQFVDLAGSERLAEAHGGRTNAMASQDMGMWQGMATNFSLLCLSKTIRELIENRRQRFKKKSANPKKQAQIDKTICNNPLSGDLVALLGASLVGSAYTAIVVCVSQAPGNAQQSSHALDFGKEFSKLRMDRLEAMPFRLGSRLRAEAEKCLAENGPSLDSASTNKYVIRRQAMARDAMALLAVLDCFPSP